MEKISLDSATKLNFKDNEIISDIIPGKVKEMGRDIIFKGDCIVRGSIYAENLNVETGPLTIEGAVYAHGELFVHTSASGEIEFKKSVGCSTKISSFSEKCRAYFYADVTAKEVILKNAYIAANVFADEITLENCVVVGGVFANKSLRLKNCVVGTFNAQTVMIDQRLDLLLPTAYSIEPVNVNQAEIHNFTLTDLGSLYFGEEQSEKSGRVKMDPRVDEVETVLYDENDNRMTVRSFGISGKILLADLIDMEGLENHLILRGACLSSHLLKNFNTPRGEIEPRKIADFFFDLLSGKIQVRDLSLEFSLADLKKAYS